MDSLKSRLSSFSWIFPVVAHEFALLTSYRFDFWMKFLGKTSATFFASYFIWASIFHDRGMEPLNGFTFQQMLYYSILAPLVSRISVADEFVGVEEDVYGGSLNRYLILPLPYGFYKFTVFATRSLMTLCQSLLLLFLVDLFNVAGLSEIIEWPKILVGFACALGGSVLYFFLAGALEMVSFWQDQVWNLIVGTRFIVYFASGLVVPLKFYPPWMQEILLLTPFPYLVGIPVQLIFAREPLTSMHLSVYFFWLFVLIGLFMLVWERGKIRYSGVGL